MSTREPEGPARDRILVADAEEAGRTSVARLLRSEGKSVTCAGDAAEAASLLATRPYDLLILDCGMAGNRDLELVRQLTALNVGLSVIVTTASPTLESAMAAVELPVLAYLPKPVAREVLLEHVTRGLIFRSLAGSLGAIENGLQRWSGEIQRLRREFQAAPAAMVRGSLLGALTLTLGRTAESLLDLEKLIHLAVGLDLDKSDGCALPNCPRREVLEGALREGIRVLEATKDSFRSKEMGTLRKRYESLLGNS